MSLLNEIEDKFNQYSLKVKIEIFVFPLLILILLNILLHEEKNTDNTIVKSNIFNIKMQDDISQIVKDIESFVLKNSIELLSINSDDKKILIKCMTSNDNLIKLIKYLEDYNNFSSIEKLEKKDDLSSILVSFNQIYSKKSFLLDNKINKKIEKNINVKESKIEYKLTALIFNKALINGKWRVLNSYLGEYKLIKIGLNHAVLSNGKDKIVLRLHNNEYK